MDGHGNIKLGGLLSILGINLDNILDLGGLNVPGVNIITAGPVFTLLKIAGIDLGWTPGTANAVANAINSTPYLPVKAFGEGSLIDGVLYQASQLGGLGALIGAVNTAVNAIIAVVPGLNLDLIDVRVPITVGLGLGAFSAGQAYSKVLADLANQPGGLNKPGPILGSLTVLPLILLNNLGRANGGMLARFYPIGDLLGINFITPDVAAAHSGGVPLLNTGLALGGANLLPIKVDATLEYQPFSDLAAWPNPFSLANNLVAGTLPTYLLRGISTNTLLNQLSTQLGTLTGGLLGGNPLAVNIYLTVPTRTLPFMEPMYLTGDVLNMVSFGTLGDPVYRLANAFAPAMTSLVNLGYTDVVRNPDGTYSRTLNEAGTPTPFFSFPNIDWQKVPGDVMNSLVAGFQKEFFSGSPTPPPVNAVQELLKLLTGGKLGDFNPLGGLAGTVQNLLNGLLGTLGGLTQGATINSLAAKEATIAPLGAAEVPSTTPKLAPLSANLAGFTGTSKPDEKQATDQSAGEKGKTVDQSAQDPKAELKTEPKADEVKTEPKKDEVKTEPTKDEVKPEPKADPKAGSDAPDTKTGNKHTPGKHAAPAGTPSTPDSGNAPKHATDGSGDKAEKDKSDSDTGGSSQTGGSQTKKPSEKTGAKAGSGAGGASGGESAGNAG